MSVQPERTPVESLRLRPLLILGGLVMVVALLLGLAGGVPLQAQERSGYDYTVQPGDSWPAVSRLVGLSVADLQTANPQAMRANGWLRIGEKLFVPTAPGAERIVHVVQYGESWNGIAIQYGVKARLLQAVNAHLVRRSLVIYRGEQLFIPPPSDMAGLNAGAVSAVATPEPATPEPAATDAPETPPPAPEATALPEPEPEATATALPEPEATATPLPEPEVDALTDPLNLCPERFVGLPDYMDAVLAATENDTLALGQRLTECGALSDQDQLVERDLNNDSFEDIVIRYSDPFTQSAGAATDLIVYVGGEDGFTRSFRARAAGQVELLVTDDINADGQPDLAWTDRTCGATNCFTAVNVRSWDGAAWVDWTEGTITIANLEDVSLVASDGSEGQGSNFSITGGVYTGAAAGPQRARTEVWASIAGAPYSRISTQYFDSVCLYHVVLDANALVLENTEESFAQARDLYARGVGDPSLEACSTRENEIDELRAFSLFRLALISAYSGDSDSITLTLDLLADNYADSEYDKLAKFWRTAYETSGNPVLACQSTTLYAGENPETWRFLDDYGFANPSFSATDVCPVLEIDESTVTFVPVVGSASTSEEVSATEAVTDSGEITGTVSITVSDVISDVVEATAEPQGEATTEPTEEPTAEPVAEPTAEPAEEPTAEPMPEATGEPTEEAAEETAVDLDLAAAECPTDLDAYRAVLGEALAVFEGDPLVVETWLRLCGAMDDQWGAVLMQDLNNDQLDDFVLFPVIVSDSGYGPGGTQGLVLVYYGNTDGSYTLAAESEIPGAPAPLALDDINEDGLLDLAWTVESCSIFCITQVQILTWDGEAYASGIELGAAMPEATVRLQPVGVNAPGQGQQLVLEGGNSGMSRGGLAITHTEVWQSVDGAPYTRISWTYDREDDESQCLGLRLVEADVAMQASPLIGYEPAIQLYQQTLADQSLQACSVVGETEETELALLRGLAAFRFAQALALNGEAGTAQAVFADFLRVEPESPYREVTETWLNSFVEAEDAAAACEAISDTLAKNKDLWQITDNFGFNHPPLAAEDVCYAPPIE